jgi:phage gp36-like protein
VALPALIDRAYLAQVAPQKALDHVATADQDAACLAASGIAYGYLRGRYELPLSGYGADLKLFVAWIALYLLLWHKNVNPQNPAQDRYRTQYADAMAWLEKVRDAKVTPADLVDADPPTRAGAYVATAADRGW